MKFSRKIENFLASMASYPLAKEYDIRSPGAINLASNESPYGPSPKVIRTLREEVERAGVYPDPKAGKLKEAIAKYVGVDPACISIGNGSDELMDLTCRLFLNEGEMVAIPLPSFPFYELSSLSNGGKPFFFNLPGFMWKEEILEKIEGKRLLFAGRPNNPTGTSPDETLVEKFAERVDVVVLDEAYVEFAGNSLAKAAAEMENVIVLRTFSKAFGLAGLRIGYAICNRRIAESLEKVRAPFNVNRMAQAAALAALQDLKF
ncbi:MAG: pyridoxal phosphate-dependent aminotransferase, partial [Candidatus Hadarchaeales archaeon]